MDFITDAISNGFWKMLSNFATDTLNSAIELIIDVVVKLSSIDQYFDTGRYLPYIYAIAGAILVLCVVKEALKIQAGISEDRSISNLAMRIIVAGTSIYFLPWMLKNVLIPANNFLMDLINSIGIEITVDKMKEILTSAILSEGTSVATFVVVIFTVWAVSLAIFSVAAGIRYAELILAILMAPIIATSFVKDGEGITAWIMDTICLVFTQSIHLILLQVLLQVNLTAGNGGMIPLIISIGIVTVALRGPKVIKKYLYTSGVGGASVGAAGNAGRMAMMRFYMSKVKP